MLPVILTVAGSDPSGGAGIQADLLTIAVNGGYGTSAVTAITVQNSLGLHTAVAVKPALVRAQMEAILEDMPVVAVKTGMLLEADVVVEVAAVLRAAMPARIVVDPVMAATRGGAAMDDRSVQAILDDLMPLATLLTPNVPELDRLAGGIVRTVDDAVAAGRRLVELGAKAVLVKGGHLPSAPGTDVLVSSEWTKVFPGVWQEQPNSHGTGCVLSAAIATFLGRGDDLRTAVGRGRVFLAGALENGVATGRAGGSVNPMFRLIRDERDA